MTYEQLFEDLFEHIDIAAWFDHCGVHVGDVGSDGWTLTQSCFAPGKRMRVNSETGEWEDEFTQSRGGLVDFVIALRKMDDTYESKVRALRELCEFANLNEEFEACATPPEIAHVGITPRFTQDQLDGVKVSLTPKQRTLLEKMTGINGKMAAAYYVGWRNGERLKMPHGCYLVPVPDPDGSIHTLRLVGEQGKGQWAPRQMSGLPKMERIPKVFGADELIRSDWTHVFITFSEFDRIRLMQDRPSKRHGAIAFLEQQFNPAWRGLFKSRNVIIVPHTERSCISWVNRALAPILCDMREKNELNSVRVMSLPISGLENERTLCDWLRAGGNMNTFARMIETAPEWKVEQTVGEQKVKVLKSFAEIDDPVNMDRHVQVPLMISGETSIVYTSPGEFRVKFCKDIADGECSRCVDKTFTVDPGRPEHIEANQAPVAKVERICRKICCPYNRRPSIEVLRKDTFRQVIACQHFTHMIDREGDEMRIDGRMEQLTERAVYVRVPEGHAEPLEPRGYTAVGWVRTNPNDSSVTMLIESLTQLEEGHESFKLEQNVEALAKLKALGYAGILEDLTQHQTRIFGQDELLMLTMLTFCSPLHFGFNGEMIRGWLAACLIGDSGVGKSRVFEKISDFVGVGDIFSCLSGRRTGLTYAIVRTLTRWRCQAGLQPLNTRRILCIDEAHEMSPFDMKSVADAMDTGMLIPNGVARASYETKTRLLFSCNPANKRTMQSYQYGCTSLKDVFHYMVIRRMDICAFVRRLEENKNYNRKIDAKSTPQISSPELRSLIFFAWSLRPNQIVLDSIVEDMILKFAESLSGTYGGCDDIPLVCPSDFRKTLARVAVAAAVLDLSVSEDFKTVRVDGKHVNIAVNLFTTLYSHRDCALDRYSDMMRRASRLDDYPAIKEFFESRLARMDISEPLPRLVKILQRGIRYPRPDYKRLLKCSDTFLTQAFEFLLAHSLIDSDPERRIGATPKFTRFFTKFFGEFEKFSILIESVADEAGERNAGQQESSE